MNYRLRAIYTVTPLVTDDPTMQNKFEVRDPSGMVCFIGTQQEVDAQYEPIPA